MSNKKGLCKCGHPKVDHGHLGQFACRHEYTGAGEHRLTCGCLRFFAYVPPPDSTDVGEDFDDPWVESP